MSAVDGEADVEFFEPRRTRPPQGGRVQAPDEPKTSLRVSAVQFEVRPEDVDYNLGRVRQFVEEADRDGVQLVAFPEMCALGYWHLRRQSAERLSELAEPANGPTVSVVRDLATARGMGVGVGFLERSVDGRLFNSYAVCLPDGEVHVHRKLHAFEHPAIDSGDRFTTFDTPWGIRVGILVCYDNNLVENVRATALLGASVLIAPTRPAAPRHGARTGCDRSSRACGRPESATRTASKRRSVGRTGGNG